jgi:hypothetical protein
MQPSSWSFAKIFDPVTDRNPKLFPNLFVPSVQPSPVEMEHVSTTPDIAKSGPLENGGMDNAQASVGCH